MSMHVSKEQHVTHVVTPRPAGGVTRTIITTTTTTHEPVLPTTMLATTIGPPDPQINSMLCAKDSKGVLLAEHVMRYCDVATLGSLASTCRLLARAK